MTTGTAPARHTSGQQPGDHLASGTAAGELRPHGMEAAARLLLYVVVMAHLADTPSVGPPPDRFLAAAVDIILCGIAAR